MPGGGCPSWAHGSSCPGPFHPARDPAPRLSLLYPFMLHLIPVTGLIFWQHLYQACHILKTPLQGGKQPEPSDVPSDLLAPPAPADIFSEGSAVVPWGQEGVTLLWSHASVPVHWQAKLTWPSP